MNRSDFWSEEQDLWKFNIYATEFDKMKEYNETEFRE